MKWLMKGARRRKRVLVRSAATFCVTGFWPFNAWSRTLDIDFGVLTDGVTCPAWKSEEDSARLGIDSLYYLY